MIFRRVTTMTTEPAVSPEASCREVARVLQLFLDGRVDEVTAARVTKHLEACRDCGLEASTYETIRQSLARRQPTVDDDALARLHAFGDSLTGPSESDGSPDEGSPERNQA